MPNVAGVEFPDTLSKFHCHLFLFYWGNQLADNPYWRPRGSIPGMADSSPTPYTGEGRFEHFKILVQMAFPKSFEWNDWAEQAARAFCEHKHVAVAGCGGSGKSTTAAMYCLFWLLAAPNDSAVLIGSTTLDASKRRIWKNVRQYYTELVKAVGKVGETVLIGNPKPQIRSSPKDSAHGIYVIALAKGDVEKGVEQLKGFHPTRLMMIIDEADSVNDSVSVPAVRLAVPALVSDELYVVCVASRYVSIAMNRKDVTAASATVPV